MVYSSQKVQSLSFSQILPSSKVRADSKIFLRPYVIDDERFFLMEAMWWKLTQVMRNLRCFSPYNKNGYYKCNTKEHSENCKQFPFHNDGPHITTFEQLSSVNRHNMNFRLLYEGRIQIKRRKLSSFGIRWRRIIRY